jgi:hypothetical protein
METRHEKAPSIHGAQRRRRTIRTGGIPMLPFASITTVIAASTLEVLGAGATRRCRRPQRAHHSAAEPITPAYTPSRTPRRIQAPDPGVLIGRLPMKRLEA